MSDMVQHQRLRLWRGEAILTDFGMVSVAQIYLLVHFS